MKFLKSTLFLIALFFAITSLQSCLDECADVICQNGGTCDAGNCDCPDGFSGDNCEIEDLCFNVTCENDGTCVDGTCDCPDGYSGTSCETIDRTQFLANYDLVEFCNTGTDNYEISITEGTTGITTIIFNNLYNSGIDTDATISGSTVTIPSQVFGTGMVSGTGSIDGITLTLTYTVVVGGSSDICEANCEKL